MSGGDDHLSEPWWSDEAPVRTDRPGGGAPPGLDRPRRGAADVAGGGGDPFADPGTPYAGDMPYADDMPFADSGAGAGALHQRNGGGRRADVDAPPSGPGRPKAQVFIPAPEDLPPPETVFGPDPVADAGRVPDPGGIPDPGRMPGAGGIPDPGRVPGAGGIPDPGRMPGAGGIPDPGRVPDAGLVPDPMGIPEPGPVPEPGPLGGVAAPLDPHDPLDSAGPPVPIGPAGPGPGDGTVPLAARPSGGRRPPAARSRHQSIDRRRLAVVYDVDGPRVRLGVAWFAGAMLATAASPFTAALLFAVAAGLAARQVVRAWGSVSWQADVAAGIGAVPVLAALVGTPAVVVVTLVGLAVAVGAASAPDGARMRGRGGRTAAAGILALSLVPATAGAAVVLVRSESVVAAVVLVLVASAYEVGDYIVGSGAANPVEGPLAGITTATLVSLPMALVLVEPFDAGGVALLAFAAFAYPLGQVVASAVLPGAGAPAPALRRIDTLLVLAPLWAAAAGAL